MEKRPTQIDRRETGKKRSIHSILLDHLAPALDSVVAELEGCLPPPAEKPERKGLLRWVTGVAFGFTVISLVGVAFAIFTLSFRGAWAQIALFVAVAFVPHWPVGWLARLAVALGEGLREGDHKIGFRNPGAFLGIVERPLFLASLLLGFPEFIGVWFVLKG
ncbi:MAG TPA: hypothetical protein VGU64_21280, partial [Terriglobales bacterium]|nr:hypothetical protein [Terriglobales bacterium]